MNTPKKYKVQKLGKSSKIYIKSTKFKNYSGKFSNGNQTIFIQENFQRNPKLFIYSTIYYSKMNDSDSSSDESKWTVVTNKALRKKKAKSTLKKLFPNTQFEGNKQGREGTSATTTSTTTTGGGDGPTLNHNSQSSSCISPQDSAYSKVVEKRV